MKTDDFDFDLPEERIALYPAEPRHAAKMLVVQPTPEVRFLDTSVWQLIDFLKPGDALVVNNTRVIPAELTGIRTRDESTITIHVTLHKRVDASSWRAFAKPGRRLKTGDLIRFGDVCAAHVMSKGVGGEIELRFDLAGNALDRAIAEIGVMPLPTYIASKRPTDDTDASSYQTHFAEREGAVAAPTAGLHFTPELVSRLEAHGVSFHQITLHVGAGTFLPVKAEHIRDHKMHSEWGEITKETAEALNAVRQRGNRIVSVGTTSLRILETSARETGWISALSGETDIFISPGFQVRSIDALMTNFHLPKSTLFMLVSAFSGLETMKGAYRHAVANDYRFFSYGDACLLFPANSV